MNQFRKNPLLWLVVLGAIVLYTQLQGGPSSITDSHDVTTTVSASAAIGGPFALIDQDGKPVTDESFRGKYMLIYFGYSFCPDVCPTELLIMSQALDRLGEASKDVVPIFITVDPKRDTPEKLKGYVGHFGDRLIGLSGSEEAIGKAARAYRVYYRIPPAKDGAPPTEDYTVDHTSFIYLMGPDGKYLTHFVKGQDPEHIAEAIRKYLKPA
jgi:protein SCO1/2